MVKKNDNALMIRQKLEDYVSQQNKNTYNYKQAAHAIGASGGPALRQISLWLAEMAFAGDILEVAPGKYRTVDRRKQATGTFVRKANGKNFVVTDDDNETYAVAEAQSMHALNGYRVRINKAARRNGRDPEAEVIEIIEKKPQNFIGTLQVEPHFGFLKVDSKTLGVDIFIPKTQLKGGKSGDKAVVEITEWPIDATHPRGRVVDILGTTGENNAEIHAILAEFGLPYKYPEAVERAADKITGQITPRDIAEREDFRNVTTFTIDPADAKDFDDALSVRRLPNGHYEVGVHIADVTHYVQPDSIIDKEARQRATSVYLVDRVVPMLPEHLCNFVCSLRPDEEKLTYSAIFELDDDANVIKSRIARTVIRSDRRFSYEEAQQVIETGQGDLKDEILILDRLAKKLRERRFEHGSVDFDREEVKFRLDEQGHPIGVYFKVSKDANKLIEEFMLLANRTVAAFIGAKATANKKAKAFVYRVHDCPDPGKIEELGRIASTFGYKIKTTGNPATVNASLNRMLQAVKGKGEENYLTVLTLRSMAKAEYSTENIGHYGLGFDFYTHFTSPIRRYPDMTVHRLLTRYMEGGRSVPVDKLEDQCKHDSTQEQQASLAERASIKYKQVEYMADRVGDEFTGQISGVTEWGLYVELDGNKCEGLVPMRDLADDYYDLDEKNYLLRGRRRGNVYRLGDQVKVRVANANLERKQLDFILVESGKPGNTTDYDDDAYFAPRFTPSARKRRGAAPKAASKRSAKPAAKPAKATKASATPKASATTNAQASPKAQSARAAKPTKGAKANAAQTNKANAAQTNKATPVQASSPERPSKKRPAVAARKAASKARKSRR